MITLKMKFFNSSPLKLLIIKLGLNFYLLLKMRCISNCWQVYLKGVKYGIKAIFIVKIIEVIIK